MDAKRHWKSYFTDIPARQWPDLIRRADSLFDPAGGGNANPHPCGETWGISGGTDRAHRVLCALMSDLCKTRGTDSSAAHFPPHTARTGETEPPWIIGIAGSVAVGKSTAARILRSLLGSLPGRPKVRLIATDGFLLPNKELIAADMMQKKGFPQSYRPHALTDFLAAAKSGADDLQVPLYDHAVYDIVPNRRIKVGKADILIIEGINVLQTQPFSANPAHLAQDGAKSADPADYLDFSLYLDAAEDDLCRWYLQRVFKLREMARTDENSFFRRYLRMSEKETREYALDVWNRINLPNLRRYIAPTRARATAVLCKDSDHRVRELFLRKSGPQIRPGKQEGKSAPAA